MQENIVT